MSAGRLYAWLVNPKDGELFAAFSSEDAPLDVVVATVAGEVVARGTLRNMGRQYNRCEGQTDYPRAHTPDGIAPAWRGRGVGTVLYTALAVAVEFRRALGIKVRASGEGICSSRFSRSKEASAWWDRAVDAYDLATRAEDTEEFECDAYDECRGSVACDAYDASQAYRHHLVVATTADDAPWCTLDDAEAEDFDPYKGVAAVNTGLLRARLGPDREDEAFRFLAMLDAWARRAHVGASQRDDLYARFLTRDDARRVVGMEGMMPRTNPSTKTRKPPRKPAARPAPRPNPATAPAVDGALDRVAALRRAAGWGPWMDEPFSP